VFERLEWGAIPPQHPGWIVMLNEVKHPADERECGSFCYLTQILRYGS